MNIPALLETERLILRGVSPDYIHFLFEEKTDDEICQFFGCEPEGLTHYREMHEQGLTTHRMSAFFFVLVEKSSGRPLGECGFHSWNTRHHRAEVFYLLRRDEDKRQRYMSEALPVVIDYGFSVMALHRIEAMVSKENTPSIRLLDRHGFVFECTRRQDYLVGDQFEDSDSYALIRPEWKRPG